MVYLIHAVGNFASVSLAFTTEKCLSYFVKLYFIILKYFIKPYFISHCRAEKFLRLLSSVQKRLLFLLLMVYLFPAVGNFASVSLTFGTKKWKKTNRLRANYLHDAVIFHSIHKGSYLHFTVLID